jgi:hypothetical protein
MTDPNNCHFCGTTCSTGQLCCSGACQPACGTCGITCGYGEQCLSGTCRCGNGPGCQAGELCLSQQCVALSHAHCLSGTADTFIMCASTEECCECKDPSGSGCVLTNTCSKMVGCKVFP